MILLLLLILTAYLVNLVLPWWGIAITGFILGFQMKPTSGKAFGIGFLALFLLWGGQALYIHMANDGILSTRIAEMLGVGSPILVVLFTGVIGGLVSGLAVLSGSLLKNSFSKKMRLVLIALGLLINACATHAPMSEMVIFNKERKISESTDSVANSVFILSGSFNNEEPTKSDFDLKDNQDYVGNEEIGIGDWSLNGIITVDDLGAGSIAIGGAFGADITLKATKNTFATFTYSLNNSGRLIYQYRLVNEDNIGFSSGVFAGIESKFFYYRCIDEPCGRYSGPDESTQLLSVGWRNRFLLRETYRRGLGLTGSFTVGYLPEINRSFVGFSVSIIGF